MFGEGAKKPSTFQKADASVFDERFLYFSGSGARLRDTSA